MRNVMITSAFAAACMLGAALPASALTVAPLSGAASAPEVTLVSGFCGPYAHRTPLGACRPNGGPVFYHRYGWHRGWHR